MITLHLGPCAKQGFIVFYLIGMKIKQTVLVIAVSIGLGSFFVVTPLVSAASCAGVKTSIISCPSDNSKTDVTKTGVWNLLILAVNILSAGVGIAAVGGIIFGSFIYMTAGGNPSQIGKAHMFLTNVVLGIIVYAATWAFLNFIIPGGLFAP